MTSPWFCTVSVTAMLPPGVATAGGFVSAVTTRSGRVRLTWDVDVRQLFVSSVSITADKSSAHASRKYKPSEGGKKRSLGW